MITNILKRQYFFCIFIVVDTADLGVAYPSAAKSIMVDKEPGCHDKTDSMIDETRQSENNINVSNTSNSSSEPFYGFEDRQIVHKELDVLFSSQYYYFTDVRSAKRIEKAAICFDL